MKNRREFIKTVAGVAVGTALGGASLMEAAQRPAPPITGPVTKRTSASAARRSRCWISTHTHRSPKCPTR